MTRKLQTRRYKRFECIAAIEGPFDPAMVIALRGDARERMDCLPIEGGPYTGLPVDKAEGDICLLCGRDLPVHVYNGKAHLQQKLFCIYRQKGTITRSEAERLEASGTHQIDFVGRLGFIRDGEGTPIARTTMGRVNRHLRGGEMVFVREAFGNVPADVPFTVCCFGETAPYALQPAQPNVMDRSVYISRTTSDSPENAIPVAFDLKTGEIEDVLMRDGSFGVQIGSHHHVVLLISGDQNSVLKGTKAEMMEPNGILVGLGEIMPDKRELIEAVTTAVREFDPSSGVLLVKVTPNGEREMDVSVIPYRAFSDVQ